MPCNLALLCLVLATFSNAATRHSMMHNPLHTSCESPSLPAGAIHVVIAAFEEKTCFAHYLWELGLTNAHSLCV